MSIIDDFKKKTALIRLSEEKLYAEVMREIKTGKLRDGLWAKAMAESDFDEKKAKAKYVKLRVQSLQDEIRIHNSILNKSNPVRKKVKVDDLEKELREEEEIVNEEDEIRKLALIISKSSPTYYERVTSSKDFIKLLGGEIDLSGFSKVLFNVTYKGKDYSFEEEEFLVFAKKEAKLYLGK